MLREAAFDDLNALLELYLHLHEDAVPAIDEHLKSTWDQIIGDPYRSRDRDTGRSQSCKTLGGKQLPYRTGPA